MPGHYPQTAQLVTVRLRDGATTTEKLFTSDNGNVQAVAVTDSGSVALADRVADRVRIRIVEAGGQRLLDTAPGIDPDSLATSGNTVTWTRDGVPQQAVVSGSAP